MNLLCATCGIGRCHSATARPGRCGYYAINVCLLAYNCNPYTVSDFADIVHWIEEEHHAVFPQDGSAATGVDIEVLSVAVMAVLGRCARLLLLLLPLLGPLALGHLPLFHDANNNGQTAMEMLISGLTDDWSSPPEPDGQHLSVDSYKSYTTRQRKEGRPQWAEESGMSIGKASLGRVYWTNERQKNVRRRQDGPSNLEHNLSQMVVSVDSALTSQIDNNNKSRDRVEENADLVEENTDLVESSSTKITTSQHSTAAATTQAENNKLVGMNSNRTAEPDMLMLERGKVGDEVLINNSRIPSQVHVTVSVERNGENVEEKRRNWVEEESSVRKEWPNIAALPSPRQGPTASLLTWLMSKMSFTEVKDTEGVPRGHSPPPPRMTSLMSTGESMKATQALTVNRATFSSENATAEDIDVDRTGLMFPAQRKFVATRSPPPPHRQQSLPQQPQQTKDRQEEEERHQRSEQQGQEQQSEQERQHQQQQRHIFVPNQTSLPQPQAQKQSLQLRPHPKTGEGGGEGQGQQATHEAFEQLLRRFLQPQPTPSPSFRGHQRTEQEEERHDPHGQQWQQQQQQQQQVQLRLQLEEQDRPQQKQRQQQIYLAKLRAASRYQSFSEMMPKRPPLLLEQPQSPLYSLYILLRTVKLPLDLLLQRKKDVLLRGQVQAEVKGVEQDQLNIGEAWRSCAIVGNSGSLLGSRRGWEIDHHEMVMRLNNAPTMGFEKDVGGRTTLSLINGNLLHACAEKPLCPCFPYGPNVGLISYACQPAHWDDPGRCTESHSDSFIYMVDDNLQAICNRIVVELTRARLASRGETLHAWVRRKKTTIHFSTGMLAVLSAIAMCQAVDLYGFQGDSEQHHYFENVTLHEIPDHDYEAEMTFFRLLQEGPQDQIPLIGSHSFPFPLVALIS
ncbi:GT29-family glycosyltransferase [Chara braunii]|uniref:GT29-family glycosyltransferase n=1 Tax=Chara braunii TaxID=69332 RepID=A0A388KU25_CHABU|nr:GT29-family glycosyltransferase [Chara braunii]|eukprot:GBG73498.1 GT29-family glycosyltransferase [Chara braunii]